MRGGILIMAPLIDRAFARRVRWFSWMGLILSLCALAIAFMNVRGYELSLLAVLNLAAYLTAYALRLPCMTQMAKTMDEKVSLGYFVEEQAVAMPLLVLIPGAFALIGRGGIMHDLRFGFTHLLSGSFVAPGLAIGLCYAGLGVFCTFIFLDRRENTFCIPMHSCSSILAGIVASYVLTWRLHAPAPSGVQLGGVLLIAAALLIMSPLHHLPLYIRQIKEAVAEHRLVVLNFVKSDLVRSDAGDAAYPRSFITVDLQAVRQILGK